MARTVDSSDDLFDTAPLVPPQRAPVHVATHAQHADDSALVLPLVETTPQPSREIWQIHADAYKGKVLEGEGGNESANLATQARLVLDEIGKENIEAFQEILATMFANREKNAKRMGDIDEANLAKWKAEMAVLRDKVAVHQANVDAIAARHEAFQQDYMTLRNARDTRLNAMIDSHRKLLDEQTRAVKNAYKLKTISPGEMVKLMQHVRIGGGDESDSDE